MTEREMFEKVATHLLKQMAQSMRNTLECAYRGADGTSCAVGCLITDEAYTSKIEGVGITGVIPGDDGLWKEDEHDLENAVLLADVLNKSNIPATKLSLDILEDLQLVHDVHPPSYWSVKLDQLRAKYFEVEQ